MLKLDKKTTRSIFLGVAGCILLYWLLHETERVTAFLGKAYGLVSPFVFGAVIAFVLNVPMRSIENKLTFIKKPGMRRAMALAITLLAVVLVLTGVVCLLIPQVSATVDSLMEQLPGFVRRVYGYAVDFLKEHPELEAMLNENNDFQEMNWGEWIQKMISAVTGRLASVLDGVWTVVVDVSTTVVDGVLGFVFSLYCLVRKERLARQGRKLLYSVVAEPTADEIIRVLRMTNVTFSNFLSSQCLEAVILGVMFAIAMPIFEMPFMPLVSVVIAVTALIPIVGAFAGCAIGACFILVQDPILAFWFVVMFLIIQQIEGNLIYPKVVGSSVGLPGMWVLVAVGVGGGLMGVTGMLLMIPLASVLYSLAREFAEKRTKMRNIPAEKLVPQPAEIHSKFKKKRKARQEKRQQEKQKKMDDAQAETGENKDA